MATENSVNASSSFAQPSIAAGDQNLGLIKAWPVLIMCVGSTSAEIGVMRHHLGRIKHVPEQPAPASAIVVLPSKAA